MAIEELPSWDASLLATAKSRLETDLADPAEHLRREAEDALSAGPFSVVEKEILPPSGDAHDYHSRAGYYWPNPDTADGLPWVCRDGETNPTAADSDRGRLQEMAQAVETLALASYFFDEEQYAERANLLLRTWFLDPETRMNPHLEFAQSIPGIWHGSGWGIVDTHSLVPVADSIALLDSLGALERTDSQLLRGWFTAYLLWLLESDNGRLESTRPNNHATAYDVQTSVFARLGGNHYVARRILGAVPEHRIGFQLEQGGKQMWEIARTSAFAYSVVNINLFLTLGLLGTSYEIDLLGYQSADGRSIRRSLEFLIPFALAEEEWRWERHRFEETAGNRFAGVLLKAAHAFGEPRYREVAGRFVHVDGERFSRDRTHLLYPP